MSTTVLPSIAPAPAPIAKKQFLFLQEKKSFDSVHAYYRQIIILFVAPHKQVVKAGNIASQVMKHFVNKSFSNKNEFEIALFRIIKKIHLKNGWDVHNLVSIFTRISEFSEDGCKIIGSKPLHVDSVLLTTLELMEFFHFLISLDEYKLAVCFLSSYINGSRQNIYNLINN